MYKRLWIHCKKRRYFIGDAVTCSVCIHIGLLLSWCNQVPCPAKEFWIIINLFKLLSSTWSVPIMNFAGIVGSYSRQDAVKAMSLKQSFKKAHQSTKLNIWASYSYSTKFERHLLTKVHLLPLLVGSLFSQSMMNVSRASVKNLMVQSWTEIWTNCWKICIKYFHIIHRHT